MSFQNEQNKVLAPYTTFNIGGPADFFAVARTEEEIREALLWARDHAYPVTVLGGGSNVLVADAGVRGLVIKNEVGGISYEEDGDRVVLTVGAGVSWDTLVIETVSRGLWGLENLSGIPGTVGGAVVQNINAYGVTFEECVESVCTIHIPTGEIEIFTHEACNFSYRNSFFKETGKGKEYIVLSVRMKLSRERKLRSEYRSASQSMDAYFREKGIDEPSVANIREAVLHIRGRIGMLAGMNQSAGSFFTNVIVDTDVFQGVEKVVMERYRERAEQFDPWHWSLPGGKEKISTAFLMECTPFNKGLYAGKTYKGTVGISPLHTLSLVNLGGATASDIREFAEIISQTIFTEFGIRIESEICFL